MDSLPTSHENTETAATIVEALNEVLANDASLAEHDAVLEELNLDDLSDLEMGTSADPDAFKAIFGDSDTVLDEEGALRLESDLTKIEHYGEQASDGTTMSFEEPVLEAPAVKAPKAPKAAKVAKPKKDPVVRDLNELPAETFRLSLHADADQAAVIASRPSQKKIAEKFDNIFVALNAGKAPSTYTMKVFGFLKAQNVLTGGELVKLMTASSKVTTKIVKTDTIDATTSASQVGQMMVLFNVLGIATRVGQTLTLNPDSAIAAKLEKFL